MTRVVDWYFKLLRFFIVAALAVMVVLVFGNVVLRYAFNSGITVSAPRTGPTACRTCA